LAGLAIDRLFSAADARVKGIRRLGADHFFGCQASLWHVACLSHVVGAMKCFGGYMAKIIEFYIPQSFRKVSRWLSPADRGKVLAFPMAVQKSA
jgi:hypothetical protein